MELEQTKSLGKVKPKVDPSIDRYLEMRKNLSNPLGPVLETVDYQLLMSMTVI